MNRALKYLLAIFALASFAFGQNDTSISNQLRIRWSGFNVVVVQDNVTHEVDVKADVAANAIRSVRLLSANAKGENVFLLLDIIGPSVGPEGRGGQCGAGTERNLVWIKTDAAWAKLASQSFAIESCWDMAALDMPTAKLSFNGADLVVTGETFRDVKADSAAGDLKARHYTVRYSFMSPETGLQVKFDDQKKSTNEGK